MALFRDEVLESQEQFSAVPWALGSYADASPEGETNSASIREHPSQAKKATRGPPREFDPEGISFRRGKGTEQDG